MPRKNKAASVQNRIDGVREAGRCVGIILEDLSRMVRAGVTGTDIDREAARLSESLGGFAACKGYGSGKGFPGNLCVSVNDQLVHGVPNDAWFREGDLVGLDFIFRKNGWYADAAVTVAVGELSEQDSLLLKYGREALAIGVEAARSGRHTRIIGESVGAFVRSKHLTVVEGLVGHFIGKEIHEAPWVYHTDVSDQPGCKTVALEPGMTLCIEPVIKRGSSHFAIAQDGFSVVSTDGHPGVHFEHTILMTKEGAEILTLGPTLKLLQSSGFADVASPV